MSNNRDPTSEHKTNAYTVQIGRAALHFKKELFHSNNIHKSCHRSCHTIIRVLVPHTDRGHIRTPIRTNWEGQALKKPLSLFSQIMPYILTRHQKCPCARSETKNRDCFLWPATFCARLTCLLFPCQCRKGRGGEWLSPQLMHWTYRIKAGEGGRERGGSEEQKKSEKRGACEANIASVSVLETVVAVAPVPAQR